MLRDIKRGARFLVSAIAAASLCGCGAGAKPEPAPPCEQACQDGVGLRGLRETMKLAFNLLIQGRPVGAQDAMTDCRSSDGSEAGTVQVSGDATANAVQGASFVDLAYDFEQCAYSVPPSAVPNENYALVVTGRHSAGHARRTAVFDHGPRHRERGPDLVRDRVRPTAHVRTF